MHTKYIEKVMYVYNATNPRGFMHAGRRGQLANELQVRAKAAVSLLTRSSGRRADVEASQ
jgi:predicted ATP-grasp superfamily ATP-dependent carboligase